MKKLPPESRIRTYACCYGAVYFATVSMKTLYSTFLVSVALQGYQLPLEWFYFGQAVLGAWNAVDDSIAAVFASWLHRCSPQWNMHGIIVVCMPRRSSHDIFSMPYVFMRFLRTFLLQVNSTTSP